MHINAYNDVKYINNNIDWYYASKFIQLKNMYIFKYISAIYVQCLLVIPFESLHILWHLYIKCIYII